MPFAPCLSMMTDLTVYTLSWQAGPCCSVSPALSTLPWGVTLFGMSITFLTFVQLQANAPDLNSHVIRHYLITRSLLLLLMKCLY